MSTVSVTSINGKRCTARRRATTSPVKPMATAYSIISAEIVSTITTTIDAPFVAQTNTPISILSSAIVTPPLITSMSQKPPLPSSIASTTPPATISLSSTAMYFGSSFVGSFTSSVSLSSLTTIASMTNSMSIEVSMTTLVPTKASSTKTFSPSSSRIVTTTVSTMLSALSSASSSSSQPIPPVTPLAQEDEIPLLRQKGTMVGGILGGFAFVFIIVLISLLLFKRRKKHKQGLLQPLSSPSSETKSGFYDDDEDDDDNMTLTSRIKQTLATVNAVLGSVFAVSRWTARPNPRVNLDRGNSQFIAPAPIAQHSRNTSLASLQMTLEEESLTWWQKVKWTVRFKLANHQIPSKPRNPFTRKDKKYEIDTTSDLARFIDQQRRETSIKLPLTSNSHRRNMSQQGNLPPLINPFADPRQPTIPTLLSPQRDLFCGLSSDPFADPLPPLPLIQSPKVATSRPRAPSSGMPSTTLPTIVELPTPQHSRLPSTASSSSRNTMLDSADNRSARGRSDPFNLSPPDISYLDNIDIPTLPSQYYSYPDQAPKPLVATKTYVDTTGALPGLSLFGYGAAGLAGIGPGKEGIGRPSQEGIRPSLDNLRPSFDKPRGLPTKLSTLPAISASPSLRDCASSPGIPLNGPTSTLLDSLYAFRRMSGQESPLEVKALTSIWMNPNSQQMRGTERSISSNNRFNKNGQRLLSEDEPVIGGKQLESLNSTMSSSIYSQNGTGDKSGEWSDPGPAVNPRSYLR